jgi:hypothetical protein
MRPLSFVVDQEPRVAELVLIISVAPNRRCGSRVDRFPLFSSLMLACPRCQSLAGERARVGPTA